MKIIVSKFGGTSTANAHRLRRIEQLLRESPARRCVVLSAPGVDRRHSEKVTDLLERCWRCRDDPDALASAMARVAGRFREIGAALGVPEAGGEMEKCLSEAARTSLACLLSRGEYLCARLFARSAGLPMADAAGLIAFDARGNFDPETTRRQVGRLDRKGAVVVPGFYGADPLGNIHTFSRNGSDITGALLAAGLGAGLYENWTDVPGLMTADPAIVPEARLIPHVSYRQMRAMARAGAQVLHPACLDPVAMAGIPTRLRDTRHPERFGTLIDERCDRIVPCVAGRREKEIACVSVFNPNRARLEAALKALNLRHIEREAMALKVFVDPPAYEESLRRLHTAVE